MSKTSTTPITTLQARMPKRNMNQPTLIKASDNLNVLAFVFEKGIIGDLLQDQIEADLIRVGLGDLIPTIEKYFDRWEIIVQCEDIDSNILDIMGSYRFSAIDINPDSFREGYSFQLKKFEEINVWKTVGKVKSWQLYAVCGLFEYKFAGMKIIDYLQGRSIPFQDHLIEFVVSSLKNIGYGDIVYGYVPEVNDALMDEAVNTLLTIFQNTCHFAQIERDKIEEYFEKYECGYQYTFNPDVSDAEISAKIKAKRCVYCNNVCHKETFRDAKSRARFESMGWCPDCQDARWGIPEYNAKQKLMWADFCEKFNAQNPHIEVR